jgi:hypothetical protein
MVIYTFEELHLCALKMRMEPLLFADENAPKWAFSKRKGVNPHAFSEANGIYSFKVLPIFNGVKYILSLIYYEKS